jgi:hypothetical protein
MWLIDLFRPSYKVSLEQKGCLGCSARQAHIEDLQNLLRSEREGNSILQTVLFQKVGYVAPTVSQETSDMKPLRSIQTIGDLRRQAENREAEKFPDARKEYWTKVQAQYDKAGKLPRIEPKTEPEYPEVTAQDTGNG